MSPSAPRILIGLLLGLCVWSAQAASQDLIFVFDNSGSMRKADPAFAARAQAEKFLAGLDADTHAGVIVFDRTVRLSAPLAAVGDGDALAHSLDGVDYRGPYTDIPAAIERAIYELKTNGRPGVQKSVVFMTDGIVDTGNRRRDAERTRWLREDLVGDAVRNGIRIHGIAFTDAADLLLVQSLATNTDAEYFRAAGPSELPAAFEKIGEILRREPAPEVGAAAVEAPPESAVDGTPEALPQSAGATEQGPESAPPTLAPAAPLEPPTVAAEAPPAEPTAPAERPAAEPPEAVAEPEAEAASKAGSPGAPQLSAEELKSLEEMARDTGVPLAQLIAELETAQPGETIVMRPAPGSERAGAPALSLERIGAIAGVIVALLLALWWLFRSKEPAPARSGEIAPPPRGGPPAAQDLPDAWLIDSNGLTGESPRKLGAKPLIIGRIGGNDPEYHDYYVLNRATVGRRHAVIRGKDRGYWLIDQGSVNGTFVNDEKVLGERQLRHGDRLKFHKFEFEFQCPDGVNETIVGLPADRTIVAAADQTLAASAVELGGGTVARAAVAAGAVAAAKGASAALDAVDGGDITAVDGDLGPLEADKAAFFADTGPPRAAADLASDHDVGAPAAQPDEFDFDDEPPSEEFDAETAAFFDDATVLPTPDSEPGAADADGGLDVLDITAAHAPDLPGANFSSDEDFATATTVMPSAALRGLETPAADAASAAERFDTVLGAGPEPDDGDEALEDFLATGSIDEIPPPPDSPLPPSGGAFEDFLEANAGTAEWSAVEIDGEEIFDVTGAGDEKPAVDPDKTTILPAPPPDAPPPMDTVVLPSSRHPRKPQS